LIVEIYIHTFLPLLIPLENLSNFGTEWIEYIDQEWLKVLEERRKGVGKLPG